MNSPETNLRVHWYKPEHLKKLANILGASNFDESVTEHLQVAADDFTLFLQLEPGDLPGNRWVPPLVGDHEQRKALRRVRDVANKLLAAQQDSGLVGLQAAHELPLIDKEKLLALAKSADAEANRISKKSGRTRKVARRIFVRELAAIYFGVTKTPPTRSTKPGNQPSSRFSKFAETAIEFIHPPSVQGLDAVIKEVIAMEDFDAIFGRKLPDN